LREVASVLEIDPSRAADLWRSFGFVTPDLDQEVFVESDIEALRIATRLKEVGTGIEHPVTRALGQSMARLTEWQCELLRELTEIREGFDTAAYDDCKQRPLMAEFVEVIETRLPNLARLQWHVWRRHLLASIERMVAQPQPVTGAPSVVIGCRRHRRLHQYWQRTYP
jgi:adenylate cyclase